jgi:hypothetical protein
MNSKKEISKNPGVNNPFDENFIKQDGFLAPEDVLYAAFRAEICPDQFMKKAYQAGKITEEDWENWLINLEFCQKYEADDYGFEQGMK